MPHLPVLLRDIINLLVLKPGSRIIDCTFGDGGHSRAILQSTPDIRLLGIDTDSQNIARAKKQKEFEKIILVNDNFRNLKGIALKNNFTEVDAVVMDLGWSSTQFEESGRGFSFLRDEPLDMRLGASDLTAEEILNKWTEEEIGRALREYGEEHAWKKIAKVIVDKRRERPIITTGQLVEIILAIRPRLSRDAKIHPATKTFQALRIAVNDELNALKQALPQAVEILKSRGRLAVISFHSLEDRIVKHFFQSQIKSLSIITKKPIVPSRAEILANPRCRSAKLRVAEKIL